MLEDKDYLGDAVYAQHDGYHIILTTEDGCSITNRIALEPAVLVALDRYRKRLQEKYDGSQAQAD